MVLRQLTAIAVFWAAVGLLPTARAASSTDGSSLWTPTGLFGRWRPSDELIELRTENSKTFDNHDGTYSLVVSGPLHRRDNLGRWVELSEAEILARRSELPVFNPPIQDAESTRSVGSGPGIDNHIWGADVPYFRCQFLYLSTELMFNGWITAVGFMGDGDAGGGDTINFASHWLKDTSYSSFSSAAWDDPGTLVWGESTLYIPQRAGWVSLRLANPVLHIHGKNLLVSYYHQDGTIERSQWYSFHSTGTVTRGKRGRSNSVNPPPMSTMTTRADILITYVPVFPDLQTSAIVAPLDTVAHGATVTPRATVRNNGPVPAIRYSVRLDISGGYSNTQNKTDLAVGAQTTISFNNWTASNLGDFTVSCTTALGGDSVPENNRVTANGFVRRLDAEALEILAPAPVVDSGASIIPQVRVRNNGNTTVTFPVLLTINGGYANYAGAVNLTPGESRVLNFAEWTAPTRGSFTITATTQLSGDQSSANNTISRPVFVRVLDIQPTQINSPGARVDSGTALLPIVTVRNNGNVAVSCSLSLSITPDYHRTIQVAGLEAGESRPVIFPAWLPTLRGPAAIRCSTRLAGDFVSTNDFIEGATFVTVNDIAALSIETPRCSVLAGTVAPRVRVANYGNDRAPVSACWWLADQPELKSTVYLPAGLPTEAETTLVFPELTIPAGSHIGRCSLDLAGDQLPDNNALAEPFFAGHIEVGAAAIIAPPATLDTAEPVRPMVSVHNWGSLPALVSAIFRIEQDGAPEYEGFVVETRVEPDGSATLVFDEWLKPHRVGPHLARCSLWAVGDNNPANDTISLPFKVILDLPPHGWSELTSLPPGPSGRPVKDGACLAWEASTGSIFAAKGNKTSEFWRFDPLSRDWLGRRPIPAGTENRAPGKGAAACSDNAGTIYLVKGNNTRAFWSYDVHRDTWIQLPDVPAGPAQKRLKGGSDLVWHQQNDTGYVYLLKGGRTEFYRYCPATGQWQTLADAPAGSHNRWDRGSWLCPDGNGRIVAHKAKYHELHIYDPADNRWSGPFDGMPFSSRFTGRGRKAKDGSDAVLLGNLIYAFKGGNTSEFFHFDPAGMTWTERETIPSYGSSGKKKRVKGGGGLVSDGTLVFAFKGNGTSEFWVYTPPEGQENRLAHGGTQTPTAATALPMLTVGPNPARVNAVVRWSGLTAVDPLVLTVHDAAGRTVLSRLVPAGTGSLTLDIATLPAGVYLVRAGAPGRGPSQKLVVSR